LTSRIWVLALDPEVHGVASYQARRLDLLQDLALEDGVDVPKEDGLGTAITCGDLRLEELEHVEVGADGVAGVEVERVAALPVEGLAFHPLQPLEVDRPATEDRQLLLAEVLAHHTDQVDRREEGRRHREVGGAPAQDALSAPEGGLDRVVGDAADHQDGHALALRVPTRSSGR
jgi:hypothetical protein